MAPAYNRIGLKDSLHLGTLTVEPTWYDRFHRPHYSHLDPFLFAGVSTLLAKDLEVVTRRLGWINAFFYRLHQLHLDVLLGASLLGVSMVRSKWLGAWRHYPGERWLTYQPMARHVPNTPYDIGLGEFRLHPAWFDKHQRPHYMPLNPGDMVALGFVALRFLKDRPVIEVMVSRTKRLGLNRLIPLALVGVGAVFQSIRQSYVPSASAMPMGGDRENDSVRNTLPMRRERL